MESFLNNDVKSCGNPFSSVTSKQDVIESLFIQYVSSCVYIENVLLSHDSIHS